MEGFITHCGAHTVTRADVLAVPKPVWTRTHRPIDYQSLIEFIERQVERMGMEIIDSAFALNRKGQQFFAKWVLDGGNEDVAPSIVARQAYDKMFKPAVGLGVTTFVCDNQSLMASDLAVTTKNTINGWDTLRGKVLVYADDAAAEVVPEPLQVLQRHLDEQAAWRALPLPEMEGARWLGELFYRGLLRPQQASVAFSEWRKPTHDAFADRNLLNCYQAVTEALKRGPAATIADRHTELHAEFATLATGG